MTVTMMKSLVLVVGCLLVGVLAGPPPLYPRVLGGGYAARDSGVQQSKATDGVRDWADLKKDAQRWTSEGQQYGRKAAGDDDASSRHTAKAHNANSDHGSRASDWDQSSNAASQAANKASQSGYAATRWADGADASHALKDQLWSRGNRWHKGGRNNDDVNYAYDKKFDLQDAENGAFQLAESESSHALDDLRDRAGSFDRDLDRNAAWASAADAVRADQNSARGQHAASDASAWDKFYRDSGDAQSGSGRDKDWANKIDRSQGGHRLWSDARNSARDVYNNLAAADGSYKRVDGYGKVLDYASPYGYGQAAVQGYAAKPAYYAPSLGYGKGADAARAWDQASKAGAHKQDSTALADQTRAAFNRDQWLNDRDRGFQRHAQKASNDKQASDWAKQSAHTASKADAAHTDSANTWNNDQGKSDFDENLWKKEAERQHLRDRHNNNNVYKKWFNNKRRGGANSERLKYDVDQADDLFGHDTDTKKDWEKASNANQWRSAADANGRNAWAASQAATGKNAQTGDWKKDAKGWQNADIASRASDSGKKQGWNNEQWNDRQARQGGDARAQNAQAWDRDANTAGSAAAAGGSYGSFNPKVGLGYGYPANGYNAGYGYPYNGYGYNYGFNGLGTVL